MRTRYVLCKSGPRTPRMYLDEGLNRETEHLFHDTLQSALSHCKVSIASSLLLGANPLSPGEGFDGRAEAFPYWMWRNRSRDTRTTSTPTSVIWIRINTISYTIRHGTAHGNIRMRECMIPWYIIIPWDMPRESNIPRNIP